MSWVNVQMLICSIPEVETGEKEKSMDTDPDELDAFL